MCFVPWRHMATISPLRLREQRRLHVLLVGRSQAAHGHLGPAGRHAAFHGPHLGQWGDGKMEGVHGAGIEKDYHLVI